MKKENKILKYLVIVFLSLLSVAVITEYTGDEWEENVRKTLYSVSNDSIPNYARTITDQKGIPFVRYAALNGVKARDEYNPTIISNYAIDYYTLFLENKDTTISAKFLNCINWLSDHISYTGNYALYEFNWQQPFYDSVGVPWTSGMTSGRAIEAFTFAYELYGDQQYIEYSKALLRGFYHPINSGAFTYKESSGWWYEEYADSNMHTPRVLDGHIYALLGVHKFWLQTKNDSAAYIAQQGIQALKSNLPVYDTGNGWSYYDAYKRVSDKKYHVLLTGLMNELFIITNDPVFETYYHKWEKPLNKPYLFRIIKERNRSGLLLVGMLAVMFFTLFYFIQKIRSKKSK